MTNLLSLSNKINKDEYRKLDWLFFIYHPVYFVITTQGHIFIHSQGHIFILFKLIFISDKN